MAQLSWEERIKRVEQAPKEMQTMVAKAFLRDDIDDENVQYLFNTDTLEEMNDPDTVIENENAEMPEGVGAMGFSMRTSKPCDNLNYIRTGSGGWNTCIKGNPCDPHADVLANCVGYASGRFNEIINEARNTNGCTYRNLNCNAANFDGRASEDGLAMGPTPRVGAIICWGGGPEGCGHVGVVERVNGDGSIYTSESGYGCTAIFWNSTRSNANGRWGMGSNYYFKCFIYQPSDVQAWIDGQPAPTPSDYYKVINGALWLLDDNGGKIRTYETGTLVKYLNDGYDKYGYHYYHVQVVSDEAIGYMASSYLEPAEAPVPPTPTPTYKFNIGDHVTVSGDLYLTANDATPNGVVGATETYITRRADGAAHPYNTTGDLGWMDESSITAYVEPPKPEPTPKKLQIGDTVKIIGAGNGSCYGDSNTALGIGWIRTILDIWDKEHGCKEDRPFPYQVGNNSGTTGFYKADALEKQ